MTDTLCQLLSAKEGDECPCCGNAKLIKSDFFKVLGYPTHIKADVLKCPIEIECGFVVKI